MTAFSVNGIGRLVRGQAGYSATGCTFLSFSACLVKLKACGLSEVGPQNLLSQHIILVVLG